MTQCFLHLVCTLQYRILLRMARAFGVHRSRRRPTCAAKRSDNMRAQLVRAKQHIAALSTRYAEHRQRRAQHSLLPTPHHHLESPEPSAASISRKLNNRFANARCSWCKEASKRIRSCVFYQPRSTTRSPISGLRCMRHKATKINRATVMLRLISESIEMNI